MSSDALNAAIALAAEGRSVFPCLQTKAPACPNGFKVASTDPAVVRDLWRRYPGPLIGVPTGTASGFSVLDIDPKHFEAREWWIEQRDALPPTRTHRTRSGGLHLLYAHRDGVRNSVSKIAPGVDIRGRGGYIVWWPAAGLPVLRNVELAPWPTWLHPLARETMAPPDRTTAVTNISDQSYEGIIRFVACAREGERNAALFWGSCRFGEMIREGLLTESTAIAILVEAAARAGLPHDEADRTARSGIGTADARAH
jgi:hypothetical protein